MGGIMYEYILTNSCEFFFHREKVKIFHEISIKR